MKSFILGILFISVFTVSCGNSGPQKLQQDQKVIPSQVIIGEHHRKQIESINYGYGYIGKLKTPTGNCTASLVGRRLVLTAGHCVYENESREKKTGKFHFSLYDNDGALLDSSSVYTKTVWAGDYKASLSNDWAILLLKNPLGKQWGYFGYKTVTSIDSEWTKDIKLAGYSSKFDSDVMTYDVCNIRDFDNHSSAILFKTDCDTNPGDSGAPIFKCTQDQGCRLLGVHISGYSQPLLENQDREDAIYGNFSHYNIASSVANFSTILYKLRKRFN